MFDLEFIKKVRFSFFRIFIIHSGKFTHLSTRSRICNFCFDFFRDRYPMLEIRVTRLGRFGQISVDFGIFTKILSICNVKHQETLRYVVRLVRLSKLSLVVLLPRSNAMQASKLFSYKILANEALLCRNSLFLKASGQSKY